MASTKGFQSLLLVWESNQERSSLGELVKFWEEVKIYKIKSGYGACPPFKFVAARFIALAGKSTGAAIDSVLDQNLENQLATDHDLQVSQRSIFDRHSN